MDTNSTRNLEKLESYSLSIIDFVESLPDNFFDDPALEPPKRIVNLIIKEAGISDESNIDSNKLYRFIYN